MEGIDIEGAGDPLRLLGCLNDVDACRCADDLGDRLFHDQGITDDNGDADLVEPGLPERLDDDLRAHPGRVAHGNREKGPARHTLMLLY
jgi:hypothetical protein